MGNMLYCGKFKKRGNHKRKLPDVDLLQKSDDGVCLQSLQSESRWRCDA